MAEELIIKVDTSSDDNLGSIDKKLAGVAKSAEKADNALGDLRKEIKSAKSDMLKYEEGTVEYSRALNRAAAAQGKFKEQNDILRASTKDFGQMMKNVGNAVGGIAGGFQVAQGAMALFGSENEATLKTIQNITAAMSITQGIVGFANGIDDINDLLVGFKASSLAAKGGTDVLSKGTENLVEKNSMLASNIAQTGAITKAVSASNVASVNAEIIALQEKLVMQKQAVNTSAVLRGVASVETLTKMEAVAATQAEIVATEEKNAAKEAEVAATNKATASISKATASISKSMLTMGLWLAAIVAVTIGITKLVEWLNKIPEDVKIKVGLEEESIKNMATEREKLRKFAIDYSVASRKGDAERVKELETFAKKEYDVEADRLKAIKTRTGAWQEAFKVYLKTAADTYYNESLAKRKTDAEAALATAEINKKIYGELIKNEVTPIGRQNVKKMIDEDNTTIAFGTAQKYKDAVNLAKQTKKELEVLNTLTYRSVDSGLGKIIKPTGGSTSTTTEKTFKIDTKNLPAVEQAKLEAEAIAKIAEDRIKLQIENDNQLTYEESEYRSQLSGIKNKFFSNDYFNENKYLKAINDAKLLDLDGERKALTEKQSLLVDAASGYKLNEDAIQRQVELINKEINERNQLNEILTIDKNTRAELQAKLDEITSKEYKTLKEKNIAEKEAIAIKAEINDLDTNYIQVNEKLIKSQDEKVKGLTTELDKLKTKRDTLQKDSQEYIDITKQIEDVDTARLQALNENTQIELDSWQKRIDKAGEYLDALSSLASGMADISQGNMDQTNAEYDRKQWAIEENVTSEEDKNKQLAALDMERWQALQKDFENQKKWKIASAWMDFASGSVKIWSGVNASTGPIGLVLSGIQQAALLATTIGNVKSIAAQQMLKPHSASSSSSGSSGSANIALNPAKDAMTSKEENLNTMAGSNLKNAPTSVVKVSEINDVQNKVKVRESNSTF